MRQDQRRLDRGFTLVELMIVVGVIGVIASLAIPNYLRFTARSSRSEMLENISKLKLHFKTIYDNSGSFVTPSTFAANTLSTVNPHTGITVGQPDKWDPQAAGWTEFQFPPEGAVKMRYWYKIAAGGADVTFTVCGSFAGFGTGTVACPGDMVGAANYRYDEVFHGSGASEPPVEVPSF